MLGDAKVDENGVASAESDSSIMCLDKDSEDHEINVSWVFISIVFWMMIVEKMIMLNKLWLGALPRRIYTSIGWLITRKSDLRKSFFFCFVLFSMKVYLMKYITKALHLYAGLFLRLSPMDEFENY